MASYEFEDLLTTDESDGEGEVAVTATEGINKFLKCKHNLKRMLMGHESYFLLSCSLFIVFCS